MPQYQTAFTILQKSAPAWMSFSVPAFIIIWTALALAIFLKYRAWRFFVGVLYIIGVLVALTLSPGGVSDMYAIARENYVRGNYSTVEGDITDFHPMPYAGHRNETFSVNGVQFSYSDYVLSPCFNNTASHGGPIREGQRVRISYSGDCILKLEIRADELPSARDRTARVDTAKADWHQQQEHDPFLNRINLGFAVAVVFMTAWWNLQPQRFIRFWLKPPYKPLTVKLFRLFFAANLIGALWHVVDQLKSYRANAAGAGFGVVAEIAAAWIAVMCIMVTAVELRSRGQAPKEGRLRSG